VPNVRPYDRLAAALCALYALLCSAWYGVWRARFAERSADEGMFENILWNAAHGHGLQSSLENGLHHLAVHFSPVLYLFVPLYRLWPSMHAVHFVTSAAIAVAGFVFHRHVARTVSPAAALPLMLAFLLAPTIVLQTFMEFHEQALAVLPLTLMLAAWTAGRRTVALCSALVLLGVREDNALLVLALGALSWTQRERRSFALPLAAAGAAGLVLWRLVGVQLLGGEQLPSVLGGTYSTWGATPAEIARAVLTRPLDVLQHVVAPVPLRYLALLLVPVLGLLPLGSRLAWLALPPLALILLADHGSRMFQIRMHYSVAPTIVLLFAATDTLARLAPEGPTLAARVRAWAPRLMLAVAVLLTPGWALRARTRLNPYTPQIRELLATLPDTASIAAPGYLLNHLAARPRIALLWREEFPGTSYVVLEDSSRFFLEGPTVDAFYSPRFDSLLTTAGYTRVRARDGWYVYRREAGR
jgi:uncharacterized membrane protein